MPIELRTYQKDIIDLVVTTDKSTLIQIPTGGGKTVVAKEIAIALINKYNKKILFVAPKLVLMEQTKKVFKDLRPQIIHGIQKYDKDHKISISTIQTASRRDLNPDIIIIDEVHYGYDGKMIEKLIKDKNNIRIIGLSATPYDENGRLLKGFDLILDKYDMNYMIQNNYLVSLKSFVLTRLALDEVKTIAGDYDLKQLGKVVCDKNTILEIVETTKKYIENSKKTIVFAVNIEHAKLLAKAYEDVGLKTQVLHSKLPRETIEKVINDFKLGDNNIKVLVSVLMLTTGFDVPDTDCAVIARPTKSQNLYKQMVGRILRIAPDKKEAILLDCGNVIDNLGNPLDPIKINSNEVVTNNKKILCESCNSSNLKLEKNQNEYFWMCKDCGYKKKIEKNSYKCDNCEIPFNDTSELVIDNNILYLKCICGYDTLISELQGDEVLVEIKNSSMSLGEFMTIISSKWAECSQNTTQITREVKEIGLALANQDSSFLLEGLEEYKDINNFDNSFKELLKLMQSDCLNEIKPLISNLEQKHDLSANNLLNKFDKWCVWQGKLHDEWKIYLFKKIDEESYYKLLEYFIDIKYLEFSKIMSVLYKYGLYNAMNYLIERYKISYFDYYLDDNYDLFEKYDNHMYLVLTESFISNLSKNIKYFDIGKSLFGNYISLDLFEDDEEYNYFLKIIDYTMYYNHMLKKYDIKGKVFEKDLSFIYASFDEAKEYIQSQQIDSLEKWINYIKDINRSIEIPRYPNLVYNELKSWDIWFGKPVINQNNFKSIIEITKNNKLILDNDLDKKIKLNEAIKINSTKYLPYEEAKKWIHNLKLKNKNEWHEYCKGLLKGKPKLPNNIPLQPHVIYNNKGWKNMDDWIGLETQKNKNETELIKYLISSKDELIKLLLKKENSSELETLKKAIEYYFLREEHKIKNKKITDEEIKSFRKTIGDLIKYYTDKIKKY